jgi:metal-responsive CopG/Arc/MetJ family transcriptional regulator
VDYYSYEYAYILEERMRIIQMTLDDALVLSVDRTVKQLKTTRSAFTRKALMMALHQWDIHRLEKKHRQGYACHPVEKKEFNVWESEQEWGE